MTKVKQKRVMIPSWNTIKNKHKNPKKAQTEYRKKVNLFYNELKKRVERSIPKAKVANKRFNAENGLVLYFEIKKKDVKLAVKFKQEVFSFITYAKKVKVFKVCLTMKEVVRHTKKELS